MSPELPRPENGLNKGTLPSRPEKEILLLQSGEVYRSPILENRQDTSSPNLEVFTTSRSSLPDSRKVPKVVFAPRRLSRLKKLKDQSQELPTLDAIIKPAVKWLKKKAVDLAIKGVLIPLIPFIEPRIEPKIIRPIQPEYEEGFKDAILKAHKDPETLFIIVSNHQGYADGAAMAVISKDITNIINAAKDPKDPPFRGFLLGFAASLEAGHQGPLMQTLLKYKDELERYSLTLKPLTREKDKILYGMNSRNGPYIKSQQEVINKEENRTSDGIAFLLPGNLEEGRRFKDGPNKRQRKGCWEDDFRQFNILIKLAEEKRHRKIKIISVTFDGSYNIVDPAFHNLPTPKAIITLFWKPKGLMTAKVRLPEDYDDIVRKAWEQRKQKNPNITLGQTGPTTKDVGHFMMKKIAKKLPENMQGMYRNEP